MIVATHNRREQALRLLGALARQRAGAEPFEVVAVVDGSTDGTADALRATRWPFTLRVVEQPRGGAAAARNRGAAAASGTTLVFMDDDVVPPPDFLEQLDGSLDAGADVVLPLTLVGDWVPDGIIAREQRAWDAHGAAVAATGVLSADEIHFAATAVRRRCFDAVGGFDPSLTADGAWGKEDTELAYRLLRAGCRVAARPDVVVTMDCVTDPVELLRRARALGRSDARFARMHPELAPRIFRTALREARIQRAIGWMVLAAPGMATLLRPLRALVLAAMGRARAGALVYRLWLAVWSAEWWRGVLDAGGGAVARRELYR
ncbi:MAG TPA: glycosyltransferase [Gemmatimonadaceae bacterium]